MLKFHLMTRRRRLRLRILYKIFQMKLRKEKKNHDHLYDLLKMIKFEKLTVYFVKFVVKCQKFDPVEIS